MGPSADLSPGLLNVEGHMDIMTVCDNSWTSLKEIILNGVFQDKVVLAQELKLWSGLELDEAASWSIRNGWPCILEAC